MKRPSPWVLSGNTLSMTAVGAFLGYMAFGTYEHAGLFGYLSYLIQMGSNTTLVQAYRAEARLSQKLYDD